MSFYRQKVSVISPAKVPGDYGGFEWTLDPDKGATVTDVPGVDVQPRMVAESLEDGTRVMVTVGLRVHTPPGKNLIVTKNDVVVYNGLEYQMQGEPTRWPSDEYPSGVDHVTLDLERREG